MQGVLIFSDVRCPVSCISVPVCKPVPPTSTFIFHSLTNSPCYGHGHLS